MKLLSEPPSPQKGPMAYKKTGEKGVYARKKALSSLNWDESAKLRGATQIQADPWPTPLGLLLREGDRPRLRGRW